jgi:NNP family nitrate/nitrite transporter-like MFS transporter
MTPMELEVPVDENLKCTEFKPFKFRGPCLLPHCGRRRTTNPHMRAFWAATLAFMFAFIGWFAFAPLMTVVRKDIGLCENDAAVQMDIENTKCECNLECKKTLGNAQIASVSLDVFTRFILGSVIERFGPKNTDVMLLLFGSFFVACGCFVSNGVGLIIVRFFVSCVGSTFVVNQFWNSIMFNNAVVGTANATAGGWANLGGGITQTLMPLVYKFWHDVVGLELTYAWRAAMLFPAAVFVVLALWIYLCSQDTVMGKFDVVTLGKTTRAGPMTYVKCLSDYRVVLMIFQYSACFGCELVMNNTLATHFEDYFGVDIVAAGALATSFGGMNLFARSLGGILSDWCNKRWAMPGRLWAHFIALFGQAVFLFVFGCVTKDMGWPVALAVLVVLSTFVNMAEGTSYGIVPYMIPEELAIVSAMVGAGGTLGAVIATRLCYMTTDDDLLPFRLHAGYVLFWALTVFAMRWKHLGSMFGGAKKPCSEVWGCQKAPEDNEATEQTSDAKEVQETTMAKCTDEVCITPPEMEGSTQAGSSSQSTPELGPEGSPVVGRGDLAAEASTEPESTSV